MIFSVFRLPLYKLTRFPWCMQEDGKLGSLDAVGVA